MIWCTNRDAPVTTATLPANDIFGDGLPTATRTPLLDVVVDVVIDVVVDVDDDDDDAIYDCFERMNE